MAGKSLLNFGKKISIFHMSMNENVYVHTTQEISDTLRKCLCLFNSYFYQQLFYYIYAVHTSEFATSVLYNFCWETCTDLQHKYVDESTSLCQC